MRFEEGRPVRRSLGLTPLIDVVFLLLIFFMLTTRFGVESDMPLRLEPASLLEKAPADPLERTGAGSNPDTLVVRLDADGGRWIGDERIDPHAQSLVASLSETLRAEPLRRVVVASQGSVSVQRIVDALLDASHAGARVVSLAKVQ